MSRARDTFRYQSSDEKNQSGRAVGNNRTISYGAALVAAAIIILLTIAFWAF